MESEKFKPAARSVSPLEEDVCASSYVARSVSSGRVAMDA